MVILGASCLDLFIFFLFELIKAMLKDIVLLGDFSDSLVNFINLLLLQS